MSVGVTIARNASGNLQTASRWSDRGAWQDEFHEDHRYQSQFGGSRGGSPHSFATDYATRRSTGSRSDARYRTASGAMAANLGEENVRMTTEGEGTRTMTFQAADIPKPLASAGRITSKEHHTVLGDEDAHIQHVFIMRMTVLPPTEGPANDDKINTRVFSARNSIGPAERKRRGPVQYRAHRCE